MLQIVLDTNIIVSSLASTSAYHAIIESYFNDAFCLCISNEILLEYEEILKKKYNAQTADFFINAVLINPTTIFSTIHYKWQLINSDIDDNKFVDCALQNNAILVTNDKLF
ncbi:MAG: putative toxin-antitoxin system toxin component, PIN family [Chitinophagales bacterium]